jgi:ferredoxin
MKIYKLKTSYTDFISALLKKDKQVIAPQTINNTLLFGKVAKAEDALQPESYINTVRSAKEFMFPQTEPIVEFKFNNKDIQLFDTPPKIVEKIIIGLRPCDAAAFPVIDDIFNYEYKDEFYLSRRKTTTLIGIACENSDASCFCTSVGIKPDSINGSDIFLTKSKPGSFVAYVNSLKGEEIIKLLPELFEEITGTAEENPIYKQNENKIREPLDLDKIKEWLNNNFNNPVWDEYSSRCLGCASCAFLCPTCHCFDIVDENKYNAGLRRKNWDACQFPIFTVHASGHNPRDAQSKRYRQRVMHKFKYYSERFGKTLCTGCGRCIRACPVNLDIYEIVKNLPETVS